MPIVKPKKGEKQNIYISRCIRALAKADPKMPNKQRTAICYSTWRKSKGKHSDDGLQPKDLIGGLQNHYDDTDMTKITYLDGDFAFARGDERFLQWARNGILNPSLLLNSLKTVNDMEDISDEERKIAKEFLLERGEAFVKATLGEK